MVQKDNASKARMSMAVEQMNVSLSPQMAKFIRAKVKKGEYTNASEVVRDAVRRMQEAEAAKNDQSLIEFESRLTKGEHESIRRGVQQGTAVTVLLMQFGKRSALVKEIGEAAVNQMMEQIGQLFSANIRTNDLAFRYDETTVALVLGDTGEKDGLQAVEKLRRLLNEVRLPGKDHPVEFCAALAQAVIRQHYDPVDIVTEVVNRAEHALELAMVQGPGKVVCQSPQAVAAAVA